MASLSDRGREYAQGNQPMRLLPVDVSTWTDIAASVAFGPFEAGDWIIIVCDAPAHVNAAAADGAATAANPQLPAGVHDFVMPSGVTHVHLFGAGAGNGCAYKRS